MSARRDGDWLVRRWLVGATVAGWCDGDWLVRRWRPPLLGVDLAGDPGGSMRYVLPALEIMGRGIITPETYERSSAGLHEAEKDGT